MKNALAMVLLATAAHAQIPVNLPAARPAEPAAAPTPGGGRGAAQAPAGAAGRGRGAAAPSAAAPSPKDLKYPSLRALHTPATIAFTLPNGMKVVLLEDRDLPVTGGVALVRAGTLTDPPERIGMAHLASILLRTGGTTVKTGEQVDNLLDGGAASLDSQAGESAATLAFSSLTENTAAALELFREVLVQPGFRPDRVEMARAQMRDAIAHRNDNPAVVARREFGALVYGAVTPFGWREEYTTVDRLTSASLRAFHQRYYFPANVTLGVWGDFAAAEMKASLEKLFGGWTAQQQPVAAFPKIKDAPAPGVFVAEKKDVTQSYFTMGHLGGLKSDKDCAAMEVLAAILGGGPESRIAVRLRTKLGIPNDVTAAWNADYAKPGLLEISGTTKAVSTTSTLLAIKEEIERLRTAEVSEEEWRLARDAAVHRMVFTYDSLARQFAGQMVLEFHGYPKDYLAQHQKALEAVTRADLLRVAKQHLRTGELTIVVVTNPQLLAEPLERLGPVTALDLTIPQAKPDVADTTDASMAKGRQLLAAAQAAAGGKAKLAAVPDYAMDAEYRIDSAVPNLGGSTIGQIDRWVSPDYFRQDMTVPAGRFSAYTDGKTGWIATEKRWNPLTGAQRSQVQGDLFRSYFRLLLSETLEGRVVNAVDDNSVQITDPAGQVANVEFDPRTHLPKRVSYDTQQATGAPIYSEDLFDDFRDVGGLLVPFKITINQGGRRFADVAVKDYKINTGLRAGELARRPQ